MRQPFTVDIPCEKEWLVQIILDIDYDIPVCCDIENGAGKLSFNPNHLVELHMHRQTNYHHLMEEKSSVQKRQNKKQTQYWSIQRKRQNLNI